MRVAQKIRDVNERQRLYRVDPPAAYVLRSETYETAYVIVDRQPSVSTVLPATEDGKILCYDELRGTNARAMSYDSTMVYGGWVVYDAE